MLLIVVDTNVLVSGVMIAGSLPDRLLTRWENQEFNLITCIKTIAEADDVLQRPHIAAKYKVTQIKRDNLIIPLKNRAIQVSGVQIIGVVKDDPKDDMFVSCAVEGNAKYIVTGDKHLLKLKRYQKIRIITVAHFLAVLERCQRIFQNG